MTHHSWDPANPFIIDENVAPITHKAAEFFTRSNERYIAGGQNDSAYMSVNQENVRALLAVTAQLEMQIAELRHKIDHG